ncbi:MAG: hypothetical protein JOZ64_08335 [Solirubrobacterales bacterium]|nr:hypothetical protein [Solirubrobacterales bacterium]
MPGGGDGAAVDELELEPASLGSLPELFSTVEPMFPKKPAAAVDSWVNSRRGAMLPTPGRWLRSGGLVMRARAIARRDIEPDSGVYELPEQKLQS